MHLTQLPSETYRRIGGNEIRWGKRHDGYDDTTGEDFLYVYGPTYMTPSVEVSVGQRDYEAEGQVLLDLPKLDWLIAILSMARQELVEKYGYPVGASLAEGITDGKQVEDQQG